MKEKMASVIEGLKWKMQWRIDKFKDPTGEVAKALQGGMSVAEAQKVFPGAFIKTDRLKPDTGKLSDLLPQFLFQCRPARQRRVALNVGLQNLIDIICGIGTTTLYNNANARLGVGSDATAADPTQTDLLDATPTWKAMDATYPQRSGQIAEWRSTFGSADANEAWNEYAVDNGAAAHKLLNRKVESKGTKVSGETWTLSLKITFS
jgi:hypothetical protein